MIATTAAITIVAASRPPGRAGHEITFYLYGIQA